MLLLNVATVLLILVLSLCLTFYFFIKYQHQHWKRKNLRFLPAKFPLGFMNPGEFTLKTLRRAHEELRKRGWKHGGLYTFLIPSYVVADLEWIKQILINDFSTFPGRGIFVNPEIDPLGDHVVSAEGEKWKNMRSVFLSSLTGAKLKIVFDGLLVKLRDFEKVFDNFLCQDKNIIRVDEVFDLFFLDHLADYVFGVKINSFDRNDEENVFKTHAGNINNFKSTLKKVLSMCPILYPNFARKIGCRQIPKDVSDFFFKIITDTIDARRKNKIVRQDFLQTMLEMKDLNRLKDIQDIVVQCFTFFIGAIETTSTAVSFALFELAKNPEIQERLRREVDENFKKFNGQISYESIQHTPYLDQVISETLRKYPPFVIIQRRNTEKYKFEDGELDKDTLLIISIWGLHFDEEYYPEPEKFDPERFSEENKKSIPKFAYLPFGDGPRRCLGTRFVDIYIKTILTYFLRNYRFSVNAQTESPFRYQENLILKVDGGIWLNVERIEH